MRFLLGTGATALLLLAACGTTVVLPGETSSNGGSTSATSTGTAGDTPTTSTSSISATATNPACQAWRDHLGNASQTIRFVNQTGQPLYLPVYCTGNVVFTLTNANAPKSETFAYDTACLQTCWDLQAEHAEQCLPCGPAVAYLGPGAALDFAWDGTALEDTPMDPSCFLEPGAGTCFQMQPAPAGVYTASASAFASYDANGPCYDDGICPGSATGAPIGAATTFPFPSNGGPVEVVFTSAGTPDAGTSDAGAPDGG